MNKEFIKETRRSVTLNVTAGKIDSLRELEKTTGTVRVYENGCIGIAGCLGEPDEKELTEKAAEALSFGIPYPYRPEGALEIEDLREDEIIRIPDFIPTMQSFLDRLQKMCPNFTFSNKISLTYNRSEYRNSEGRRLLSSGRDMQIALIVQNRGSGNLFDTFLEWNGIRFDPESVLEHFKRQYDAFYTPADIAPGRYPIVAGSSNLFEAFAMHFVADMYVSGASLLSGKLGQKAFSEKLTLRDDMNPATAYGECFFDAEGCVAPDFRPALIENGVLKGLLTTKKTSDQYGLPNIGTASATYDGVPALGFHGCYPEKTADSLKDLVPGKSVYVIIASGGDVTPEGRYASPVQMAYLMEDGKLAGRLPNLNISGEFFDIFGKDYVGSVHNVPFEGAFLSAAVMNVEKA